MNKIYVASAVVVVAIIGIIGATQFTNVQPQVTSVKPTSKTVNVQFVNHIQAGLSEQDVFIEKSGASNQVIRLEGKDANDPSNLSKNVYATERATPHDPFKLGAQPLGPFGRGSTLGMTLQQWLSATGTGTYVVDRDDAELKLSFQKLVPNGVYTLWCSRLTFPPNANVVDRPCGATEGSQNVLKADSNGNAVFNLKIKALEASSKETVSLLALAYHSDGKTYKDKPGDFGLNSHVQIFFIIPPPE